MNILYEYEVTESKVIAFYAKNKKKEKYPVETLKSVQAMFLFAIFSCQRFSDVKKLKDATIKGNKLKFNQVKTTGQVHAVLNDYAREIAEKYNYNFPTWSNQYVNLVLHHLFEMIGLKREIKSVKYIGAQRIDICEPLYIAVGFHWSRKSHATLSLEKGMRPETVMAQGGWKDRDSFKKYIAVSQSMLDAEMEKAWGKPNAELKRVG